MSNPYRARPTRSRVDSTISSGYGTHSQNSWNLISQQKQPVAQANDSFHQNPNINQPKQLNDTWEWGSDNMNNGNDSWNWSIDQQPEQQQSQQQQPQQQQNQFTQSYTNQNQPISSYNQGDYYKNINGNNRYTGTNQYVQQGNNTPATFESCESTSTYSENYSQHMNYSFEQQYLGLPRPASNKSNTDSIQAAHTIPDRQESAGYVQHDAISFSQKQQMAQPLPNNYNWNPVVEHNAAQSGNWQNHSEISTSGYWQEPNMGKQDWSQQPQVSQPNVPVGSEATSLDYNQQWSEEHRDSFTNNTQNSVASDQWQSQNCKISTANQQIQQSSYQNYPTNNQSWHQMEVPANQLWSQQSDVQSDQWSSVKQESTDVPEEHNAQDAEWQMTHNSNYSPASAPMSTLPKIESSEERKKLGLTPATSSASLNDSSATSNSKILKDRQDSVVSESSKASSNLQGQDNTEIDWNADTEWDTVVPNELSTNFSQMNLSNDPQSSNSRNQRVIAGSKTDGDTDDSVPENIPVLPPEHGHGMENVRLEDSRVYDPTKNIENANFDQWYKQGTALVQSEDGWYTNDRTSSSKQWTTESSVENYENIQQPAEFVNLEVVAPETQERDIYGSRDSINKETLDNDPKVTGNGSKDAIDNLRDYRQEGANVEVITPQIQQTVQSEQVPENYEFASNDRNTFLETGELTDSHQEHESSPPSQDDENDEVPNDIPFLREVPGQSSSIDPRRNDPTGQENYVQGATRLIDPRRNDPSGQEQNMPSRNMSDRAERRDVPSGQERSISSLQRNEPDSFERRNDPSGREHLPPQQSRNDPSGEERTVLQVQSILESSETREIPGQGNELEESARPTDSGLRQIPGGVSPNESTQMPDDRLSARVVTGSQELLGSTHSTVIQDQATDTRNKREEAVGASIGESKDAPKVTSHRDSHEDGDDDGSGHSREGSRERRRDASPERRRYDYDRKSTFYDRDRDYDDEYYYDRRRGADYDRAYNSREDLDRREALYRDDDRRHQCRDDLDRHSREDVNRKSRIKDDVDDRESRRRIDRDNRRDRPEDPWRRDRDARDYDLRYSRDREYVDRDRRRDDRRTRRYDDYDSRDSYRRDYYDDPYGRSSRPSSRSSYNDRDRDYYIRSRDPYYNYNGFTGYDYTANYNSNYYAYLENLRRTNPAAYAEWYHKYYANQHQQQLSRGVTNYPEDRGSVHSGRSSCDDRLFTNPSISLHPPNKALYMPCFGYHGWTRSPLKRRNTTCCNMNRSTSDKRNLTEMSVLEDQTTVSSRLTPTKFSTSHVKGFFSIGSLLHVHASYPTDGERARIDILRVDNVLQHDSVTRELRSYPGPLIKQVGVTHKKTIIEYCEAKIKKAAANDDLLDRASYILLYEFMIMLIQQNGNVVGVDIATLLLKNKEMYPYDAYKDQRNMGRRESTISQRSAASGDEGNGRSTCYEKSETVKQRKTVDQVTDEFRNTLLYGLVQEALEYAMDEGLWGHALFLASKLDKRTHASVMTRFANSLLPQDPLQTLYQLHSGRVPASVTCVADHKWDDWRPHLAMIISNTSANPEVNRRSITILGDTLAARGDIHAAHFCYILAQVNFTSYDAKNAKLVLIGANHQKPYTEFATTEAVMLTEIYEYARNLSEPGFTLPDLQSFKFNMAMRMVDHGLLEKALLYIEQVAVNIAKEPSKYKHSFINDVYYLGDKIKYYDPVCKDSADDVANLIWLNNLAEIVGKYQKGEIMQDEAFSQVATNDMQAYSTLTQDTPEVDTQHQKWNIAQSNYNEAPTSLQEIPAMESQSNWQPLSLPNVQDTYNLPDQGVHYRANNVETNQYQTQQQDYWPQQSYGQDYSSQDYSHSEWQQPQQSEYRANQVDSDGSQQQGNWGYESEKEEKPTTPEPRPVISMTPSAGKQYDPLEELDALDAPKKTTQEPKKPVEKTSEKKSSNAGSSWFGGFFSKLAPKPKNQMILPDDSNPTIVWDPVAKKWMNKDEDTDNNTNNVAPPPKAADMGFGQSIAERSVTPQLISQNSAQSDEMTSIAANQSKLIAGSNMFKLPKGRSMRANYIDVMNPNATKVANRPTPATSPSMPMAASSPQLFIPAPVNDPSAPMDFLTPASAAIQSASDAASQGISRWSSTSSLSREVQSYTMRDPRHFHRDKGLVTVANSVDVQKSIPKNRYPPR